MTLLATMGAIEGGWNYVIAAYAVTWIMLGGYAVSLFLREIALDLGHRPTPAERPHDPQ